LYKANKKMMWKWDIQNGKAALSHNLRWISNMWEKSIKQVITKFYFTIHTLLNNISQQNTLLIWVYLMIYTNNMIEHVCTVFFGCSASWWRKPEHLCLCLLFVFWPFFWSQTLQSVKSFSSTGLMVLLLP